MTRLTSFEGRPLARPNDDIEDQGLAFDVATILSRRRVLAGLGIGAGSIALAACGANGSSSASTSSSAAAPSASASEKSYTEMVSETAGPYPGDGSNGPDVLEESGIVRQDLTTNIDGSGKVDGVPLTLEMNLIDMTNGNKPMANAAVYVWHCSAQGKYSMYSDGVTDQTWLRGVQVSDSDGLVTFKIIVPGCYTGRWPHIHFEVFTSVDDISDSTKNVLTSQIAVPEDVATAVYQTAGYDGSTDNLKQVTLDTDNVFGDGYDQQIPTVTGSVTGGYTFAIDVPIDTTTAQQVSMAGGAGGPGGPGGAGMPDGMPSGMPMPSGTPPQPPQ